MTQRGFRRRAQSWPSLNQSALPITHPFGDASGVSRSTETPRRTICAQLCPAAKIALANRQAAESREASKEQP